MQKRTWLSVVAGVVIAGLILGRRGRFWRGKVVVITGGARGLGLLLARQLVSRGSSVAICARDEVEVSRARSELVAKEGRVFAAACDVTERAALTEFLARAEEALGPIDVLINNAGLIQVGPMELMSVEDYDAAMRIHFWAPLYATLAVLPGMRRRREGRIVNIASIGAKVSIPHLLPYDASKFALYGLSTGLRAELAKDGIVVTTVCPGLMRTGSPRHALIKGKHRAEYAWFKLADSLPVISMNADRAARKIIEACERGDAEVVLSFPAKLLAKLNALAPSFIQNLLGLVTRLLPQGGSARAVKGKDAESHRMPHLLTRMADTAARRNNEL